MEKYFECSNCKELMEIVYESECCGLLYCQDCKIKLSNNKCLKCSKLLIFQRNKFAQRLLKSINVKCKYGCGTTLPYDKMKQHLLICDKKIYICSYDNIYNNDLNKKPFKGNKKEILEHLVKEHSKILLLFMENHQNFEPNLKKLLTKNTNKEINKEDTILDLTNSNNNLNLDFSRNNENENSSFDFDQDIRILNGINDLNLINSNIQNFNDLHLDHNRINNNNSHENSNNNINLSNRINSLNSDNNENDNDYVNNNINLLDINLPRNNYQPLRELRFPSIFNENDNLNLDYRFNINNNNSDHNGNNINGHNTRNRRRTGNILNNNQNNINSLNSNMNNNIINNGANNINNQLSTNF